MIKKETGRSAGELFPTEGLARNLRTVQNNEAFAEEANTDHVPVPGRPLPEHSGLVAPV